MFNDVYGASEEQAAEYVRIMTEQLFSYAFRPPDVFINYEGVLNKPHNRDLSKFGGKIKVCDSPTSSTGTQIVKRNT